MKKLSNDKELMTQALKTIKAVKPRRKAAVPSTMVDVQYRAHTMQITFAHFAALIDADLIKPASMQRQHQWRALTNKADYLNVFELPQVHIAVAYVDGAFEMLDGNTRVFKWLKKSPAEVPSHVTLTVLIPADRAELKKCFNCYDSAKAKKTKRHMLVGALREAGVNIETDIHSDLIKSGGFVTALYILTGCRGEAQICASVHEYKRELLLLDKMGLAEKDIEVPVQAVALRLLKEGFADYALVENFVRSFKMLKMGLSASLLPSIRKIAAQVEADYLDYLEGDGKRSQTAASTRKSESMYDQFRSVFCREVVLRGTPELKRAARSFERRMAAVA
jgi:hypothetical protein